jgi:hypothetical protein
MPTDISITISSFDGESAVTVDGQFIRVLFPVTGNADTQLLEGPNIAIFYPEGGDVDLQSQSTSGLKVLFPVGQDLVIETAMERGLLFGLRGDAGQPGQDGVIGQDGREVEMSKNSTHILWRYVGDVNWINLIALADITGQPGQDGDDGSDGSDGADGADGREIELQKSATHIQWRYVGEPTWINLVALADLLAQISVASNVGLTYNGGVLSTVYNTQISDGVNSIAVGGAAVASAAVWKTRTIVQSLDAILFPDQAPTYTIPTVAISASQTGTKEIGQVISQVLSITGVKNDAGAFSQIRALRGGSALATLSNPTGANTTDIAAQFGYADPNNPNKLYTLNHTDNFVVVSGTTSWSGDVNYAAGLVKKNNKGVDDIRAFAVRNVNAPQSASNNFATSNASVNGIYPYFWGVSDTLPTASSIAAAIAAGSANKVLADASGTVTITFAATAKYLWMVHASGYTTKTKWFNTALNNGNIGAVTDLFGPVVTQAVNSPQGYWSAVNFKMYISTFATSTSGTIEFRNT